MDSENAGKRVGRQRPGWQHAMCFGREPSTKGEGVLVGDPSIAVECGCISRRSGSDSPPERNLEPYDPPNQAAKESVTKTTASNLCFSFSEMRIRLMMSHLPRFTERPPTRSGLDKWRRDNRHRPHSGRNSRGRPRWHIRRARLRSSPLATLQRRGHRHRHPGRRRHREHRHRRLRQAHLHRRDPPRPHFRLRQEWRPVLHQRRLHQRRLRVWHLHPSHRRHDRSHGRRLRLC
jgi:hypothetical protein